MYYCQEGTIPESVRSGMHHRFTFPGNMDTFATTLWICDAHTQKCYFSPTSWSIPRLCLLTLKFSVMILIWNWDELSSPSKHSGLCCFMCMTHSATIQVCVLLHVHDPPSNHSGLCAASCGWPTQQPFWSVYCFMCMTHSATIQVCVLLHVHDPLSIHSGLCCFMCMTHSATIQVSLLIHVHDPPSNLSGLCAASCAWPTQQPSRSVYCFMCMTHSATIQVCAASCAWPTQQPFWSVCCFMCMTHSATIQVCVLLHVHDPHTFFRPVMCTYFSWHWQYLEWHVTCSAPVNNTFVFMMIYLLSPWNLECTSLGLSVSPHNKNHSSKHYSFIQLSLSVCIPSMSETN